MFSETYKIFERAIPRDKGCVICIHFGICPVPEQIQVSLTKVFAENWESYAKVSETIMEHCQFHKLSVLQKTQV